MALDPAGTQNFRVGADRYFPEIKKAGAWKTGILRAPAFFEQISPRVAIGRTADDFHNLPAVKLDLANFITHVF